MSKDFHEYENVAKALTVHGTSNSCSVELIEGFHRSAISRFYYSIFHQVKYYLETNRSGRFSSGPNVHAEIIILLRSGQTSQEKSLAHHMTQLRLWRNSADYDGKFRNSNPAKIAQTCEALVRDVRKIISSLVGKKPTSGVWK